MEGQGGGRPSSGGGGGARGRHRNEGCTIKSQMGWADGLNGEGAWPPRTPHRYATELAPKRKATSRFEERQPSCPADPTSPSRTRWERAHSLIKGRFRNYITPPFENISDLPRELPSQRLQQLLNEMGRINMGLVDEKAPAAMPC